MNLALQLLFLNALNQTHASKEVIRNHIQMKQLSEEKIKQIIDHIETLCFDQCYVKSENEEKPGEPLLKREIAPINPVVISRTNVDLIYNLTLSLLQKIYGSSNDHISNFQSQLSDFNYNDSSIIFKDILEICIAKLKFIRSEIDLGLITSIENEVTGEIVADFLSLARKSMVDNVVEVAAVLSCASLEDSLKRYAKMSGLVAEDKTMSEVINALKSKGLLSSAQDSILKGYAKIRNKVFHAEWSNIEKADISSIIGFTEEFVLKHFSATL